MRLTWMLFSLLLSKNLLAQNVVLEDLNLFYEEFVSEQNAIVSTVYPQTNIFEPVPISGYLPVVITNTTGLSADEIYVTLIGQQTVSDPTQYFFQITQGGILAPVAASSTTYSPNYSYKLGSLPKSSTGVNDYLVYAPSLNGARFYFSIRSPIYLQSDTLTMGTPNQIVAPTYFAFYDPNYSNLYETVEVTFFPNGGGGGSAIAWTASINTTEVDAFGLPIRISYYSFDPSNPTTSTPLVQNPNALPSGFGIGGPEKLTTRKEILDSVVAGLSSGDLTGASPKVWPRLALPFYSNPYAGTGLQTYLRVLSPKQSLGNAAAPTNVGGLTTQHVAAVTPGPTQFKNYNYPPFPSDYLSSTSYGDTSSFLSTLFGYYTSGTKLYISTGGGSPTIYEGVSSGVGGTLTFTGISGPNTGQVNTLAQSSMNTFQMYSGSQLMSGGSDATNLGFYFGDAFTVGFLASTVGTTNSVTPPNIPINITDAIAWQPYFIPFYYIPQYTALGGPWMDLYAKLFHSVAVRNTVSGDLNNVGLCYAYDFDDSLGISGTITPSILTANSLNPYLGITLGKIDTKIPDPYSDQTAYAVTFNFPFGNTLQYRQGNDGSWISVNSGATISGLRSNRSNPLSIRYSNGQGPNPYHEFVVYLYYQFLQPVNSYNSSELNVINSTTIAPNSATPTQFTITLLP